ncbi:hypothetical protein ACJ41O_000334 [Fusarium nematophilum]
MYKIVDLAQDKIRSILQRLHNPDIQQAIEKAIREMREDDSVLGELERTDFKDWIGNLPALASLEPGVEPAELIPHIKWASRAKWVFSEHIETLFCSGEEELPGWVLHVYKLGRYFAAAKATLKLAAKQPSLFTSIHVEVVDAPEQQNFSLGHDTTALKTALQRLTEADHEQLMSQLGKIWLTVDPEVRFRQACRLKLTVHAEMQLLSFYDHYPEFTPRLFFMGTSKKACFLCHRFMSRHPLTMSVSASHQKLYPSWMPAPCSKSNVRKQHKTLLWELSRHLEQMTARDLETRLGIRRRKNLDSTAGPSLTTSGSITSGWWLDELPFHGKSLNLLNGKVHDFSLEETDGSS